VGSGYLWRIRVPRRTDISISSGAAHETQRVSMCAGGGSQRAFCTAFAKDSGFASLRAAKGTEIDAGWLVF
jgi:hypothetical protein